MHINMKISTIVIAYQYTDEQLYDNLSHYIGAIDYLIIWDNTPSESRLLTLDFWKSKKKDVYLLSTGKNEGIGYAINRAIELSLELGCTHLMTMDQDSIWKDLDSYKKAIASYNDSDVFIYAPTIASATSDKKYTCNKENLYAITSGSVLDLSKIQDVGLLNEKFIIDEVDNECCVRTVTKGYNIHVFDNIYLYQNFGYSGKGYLSSKTPNYSSFRTYHQVRNRIWMTRMYWKVLNWRYHATTIWRVILRRLFYIIIIEKNKVNKISSILKGIHDGITKSYK